MLANINSLKMHTNFMSNSAKNIANINSQGYTSISTPLQNTGSNSIEEISHSSKFPTDLAFESTNQILIEEGIKANVSAIKTEDTMLGTIMDLKA
jgi:flagellar hook protein FlgE